MAALGTKIARSVKTPTAMKPETKKDTGKKSPAKSKSPAKNDGGKKSPKPKLNKSPQKDPKSPLKAGKLQKPAKKKKVYKRHTGCIYIKHLPSGFREQELRAFFGQFGDVARVCMARSKRTQRSQGYAYIVFRFHEVARIAAEAVDNYMFCGRVLKAGMLPKHIKSIPRNFARAFNSKDEHIAAYKAQVEKELALANNFVGSQRLRNRRLNQLKRLQNAKEMMGEAGADLPELDESITKLQQSTDKLQMLLPPEEFVDSTETAVSNEEPNADDSEDDDDDSAFPTLLPSDWDTGKSANQQNDADQKESAKAAIAKAKAKKKEFTMQKLQTQPTKPVDDLKPPKKVQDTKLSNKGTNTVSLSKGETDVSPVLPRKSKQSATATPGKVIGKGVKPPKQLKKSK